jgi:GNAT superfamily N-acetyltransferase
VAEPTSVELRDGSQVLVRPVRPDDRDAIRNAFERLSEATRYRRFLTAVTRLTESDLDYLTEVDHRDHEALVAFDPGGGAAVAVARFIRRSDAPAIAEAAVVVDDGWQRRGLGSALCRLLAERAREVGVERFSATLLADNREVLRLLESLGPLRVVSGEGATITVEVGVPKEGIGEQMREILRATAAGLAGLARVPGMPRRGQPGTPR